MGERLTEAEVNSKVGWGHQIRYRLATGFIESGDTIVDAACGIGYAADLMPKDTFYYGIDLLSPKERISFPDIQGGWLTADLQEFNVSFEFDIGISFETIEHLEDYSNLLFQLKKAKKWIICSVPTIPTVHMNEYHKHDFAPLELVGIFEDAEWELYQYLDQPTEFSQIYVFKRR